MESQDNLPENIKILIQRAVASNSPELDLSNSGLNDSIIKNVLIKIKEELPDLTKLDLSDNQITAVPPEIGNLTKLRLLDLANTPLIELPPEIGNLTNLRVLRLENTPLTAVPSWIGNLTNLTELHLLNTPLTQLPSWIGNLENLIYLFLENTPLTQLPSEIENLTKLVLLDLSNTPLTQLPSWIGNLTNLRYLYLENTQLTQLPSEIRNLRNLLELHLENTQLSLKTMLILSQLEVRLVGINNDQRQVHDNLQKEGYSSIVNAFANTYPDISVEDFNTFFLRLSSDQVRGIVDFEVPLQELGIGFDPQGNISTELDVDPTSIELNDKIDMIKKSDNNISNKEALNLIKTKPEFHLQGIYDFGLTLSQASKIDSREMRIDVYELLIEKIATENHDNETPDIGELTNADKNLARASFDQIIEYYKWQQKDLSSLVAGRK